LAESEILAEKVEESQEELYKMNNKYNKLQKKYDNLRTR
jgi:molecular chaperone GrpE (heat shock protein)